MVTAASALRIVFFGTPDFAVPTLQALLASQHPVVGVVTQPDRPRGRGQKLRASPVKALAHQHGLPVLQPERLRHDEFLASLRALRADLGVVAAYGKILTEVVLAIPPKGLINVHASLLPKYRGAAPIHRAVMAGEASTGVTIMRVVQALDAGPMLSTVSRSVGPEETSRDVERALAFLGAEALVKTTDALAAGAVLETPQRDADASYAHRLTKADGIVDWSQPARTIHNQIRGLHPWPHAYSDLEGERVILLRSQVETEQNLGRNIEAGEIVEASGDALSVQTGKGVLRILELQRRGGRPMSSRDFLAGWRLPESARFVKSQQSA
ncbi:MAG: methionyl-tRNA formyltransferase [Vicinamibacterales bacterium]|nr:methionyl-tRNA formyltransferase [Vicinamibacterales bacterium]